MTRTLAVLIGSVPAGVLTQGDGGVLTFTYDPVYRQSLDSVPLSLSMPLSTASYAGPPTDDHRARS